MNASLRIDTMRCPYPDCQGQGRTAFWNVADGVFVCSDCGRLSYQCVTRECQQLNRPFSYCCRKCGMCQFLKSGQKKSTQKTVADRWNDVEQFDYDWKFRVENLAGAMETKRQEVSPSNTSMVAALGEVSTSHLAGDSDGSHPADNRPVVQLESSFLDGLLAVHQGGRSLTLLHPFADLARTTKTPVVVWSESEGHILNGAGCRLPEVDYKPEWFRPWKPRTTLDRRFALFSTPYLCVALDLWTLPGWGAAKHPQRRLVVAFNEKSPLRLAAGPVPLTVQPWPYNQTSHADLNLKLIQNQIGLLLQHNDGSYWWCCINLEQHFNESAAHEGTTAIQMGERIQQLIEGQSEDCGEDETEADSSTASLGCIRLPIQGNPVQVNVFRDHLIVFATPVGHWLWTREDALNRRADKYGANGGLWEIRDPTSKDRKLQLDSQIADRKNFSWPMQCLFSSRSDADEKVVITYATQDNHAKLHDIWVKDRDRTETTDPIETMHGCRGVLAWTPPEGMDRELLFISGPEGAIFKRIITQHEPIRLQNLEVGTVNQVFGLQFRDPLMILVCEDPDSEHNVEVQLRSLRQPYEKAVISGLQLQADPLAWSNFLFTCESYHAGIRVQRREFPITSSGTNKHLNNRTTLGGDGETEPLPVDFG